MAEPTVRIAARTDASLSALIINADQLPNLEIRGTYLNLNLISPPHHKETPYWLLTAREKPPNLSQ